MNKFQTTIRDKITCSGVGIHSGNLATITLLPAKSNDGIVFMRKDIRNKAQQKIIANYKNVSRTMLGTNLTNEHGITISTVEHLMAALWGMDIDNCIIEVNGPEIPIMDGSSEPFIFLLESAGKVDLPAKRQFLKINKTVKITNKDKNASSTIEPHHRYEIDLTIDFAHKTIAKQQYHYIAEETSFKTDLARARTFGLEEEVEYMKSQGLAKGGSLYNAIVVAKDGGVLNERGLRYDNEFVRHKILDCIGDLFLSQHLIIGKFTGYRSGHALNNQLLHELFKDETAWELVEIA